MPNDAKLGLIVGVGLVVAVAITFFHKDPGGSQPLAYNSSAAMAAAHKPGVLTAATVTRPVQAKYAARTEEQNVRRHTVKEGETLFALAERYYGDREKSEEIYKVNQDVLQGRDEPAPGMVLTIPTVAGSSVASSTP